jgi:hypothetical protein
MTRRLPIVATLLFLALCFSCAFNVGCRKKKRKGLRCAFHKKTLKMLKSVKDETALPPEERAVLMSVMIEKCEGWPVFMKRAIDWMRKGPHLGPTADEATKKLLPNKEEMAAARKYLDSICPGFTKKFPYDGPPNLRQASNPEHLRRIFRFCRYSKLKVVDEREYVSGSGPWVVLLYTLLRAGGMKPRIARLLSRLWLPSFGESEARGRGIRLPESRSFTGLEEDFPDLFVSRKAIHYRTKRLDIKMEGGRFSAEAKRDGPDGFFVTDLYRTLALWSRKRKELHRIRGSRKVAPFRGNWILAMDGRLSFRLMAEVLYTANQAELSNAQLLVRNPGLRNRVVLVRAPKLTLRTAGAFVPLALTVIMTKKGYYLKSRHGVECPDPKPQPGAVCFPVDKAGFASAARKLSNHLWFLFAKKYKDPSHWNNDPGIRSTITVVPAPRIPIRDVVVTLDAVREVPKDAKNPPVPKNLSKSGCAFEFDRKTSEWRLKKKSRPACMFHNAVLALGSM